MVPTEQQKLILEHKGNAVVIAAPGSGKTYVVSEKIKTDLKTILDHEGIIAISYTNKASNELKARSLSKGEDPKSSFFGTIDKFNILEIIIPFGKLLFGIPKEEIDVVALKDYSNEDREVFLWMDKISEESPPSTNDYDILKNEFISGKIIIESVGILSDFIFDNSIACRNYIKARYKSIYIDEYQDSGYFQHSLFAKINDLGIMGYAVGDLNQSIYAFSGKDSKFLNELTKNENFKYFKLDKNHRCHPSIINYSNYLLNPKTELIPVKQKELFLVRLTGNSKNLANWIDKKIDAIQQTFKVNKRNEIAILTKSNRTVKSISKHLNSPNKIFNSNDLDINLNIWSSIFSNLLYYYFDSSHQFIEVIETFTSYDKLTGAQLKELKTLKSKLDVLSKKGNFIIEEIRFILLSVVKLIAPNSENLKSVQLLDQVLKNRDDIDSYKPADESQINILTLHKSKGLEFDVVIHLELYEWILPIKKPGPNNDFNNPVYPSWKQDINLHYVGITRARKGCIFLNGSKRTNYIDEEKNAKDSEFLTLNQIQKLRRK